MQPPRPRAAKGARAEQATTARPSVLVATRRTCHAPLALVAHALLQNSFTFSTDLLSARVCMVDHPRRAAAMPTDHGASVKGTDGAARRGAVPPPDRDRLAAAFDPTTP